VEHHRSRPIGRRGRIGVAEWRQGQLSERGGGGIAVFAGENVGHAFVDNSKLPHTLTCADAA